MDDNNPSQFEALNFQNLQTPYVDFPELLFDWQWAFFSLEWLKQLKQFKLVIFVLKLMSSCRNKRN